MLTSLIENFNSSLVTHLSDLMYALLGFGELNPLDLIKYILRIGSGYSKSSISAQKSQQFLNCSFQ